MTISEMHYDWKLKIDKVDSFSKADFSPAEIDWLLNEAIMVIVKQRYGITNSKRSGFESSQKRIDDLKSLQIKFPLQPGITPTPLASNLFEVSLDDLIYEYWFLTRATVDVVKPNCVEKASLKLIQHDDLNFALNDPFNKSDDTEVLYNFGRGSSGTSDSIYLYPDSTYPLGQVFIEYIKKPAKVSLGGYTYLDGTLTTQQDCDLSEHLHNEIVDVAVQIASGIIESPEYVQLKTQKVFTHE
jgi:hypothetical protein